MFPMGGYYNLAGKLGTCNRDSLVHALHWAGTAQRKPEREKEREFLHVSKDKSGACR